MANAAMERTWKGQMGYHLSGTARIDRFVRQGIALHLTFSGALLSLVLIGQGLVLLTGGSPVIAPFTDVLARAFPLLGWGLCTLIVGSLQAGGYALAWTGLLAPRRNLRTLTASVICGYVSLVATATLLSGFTFGFPVYAMLVVLAIRDLSESRVR